MNTGRFAPSIMIPPYGWGSAPAAALVNGQHWRRETSTARFAPSIMTPSLRLWS
ncbi:MAG: hypothetical protein GX768_00470 [Chloroflexi bacterium]|nr:hypothetical protein [Chloroflexota bacterium]